jgi:hypothetical protein
LNHAVRGSRRELTTDSPDTIGIGHKPLRVESIVDDANTLLGHPGLS